jgi:hypothetical protein
MSGSTCDDEQQDRVDLLRDGGSYSSTGGSDEVHRPEQLHQLQLHGSLIPIRDIQSAQGPASPGLVRFCCQLQRK